ncbi:MAG: branched-chain amino acid aminotransferase [Myxococcota bacterium]|jgi:branched-chain amino acid aminotransferase
MGIESEQIWMDGRFVPYAEANVHVLSHSLHYGLGVFEGIRSYTQPDGSAGIFRLDDHLKRLINSARMCRLPLEYSLEDLRAACTETINVNGFTSCYLRPLVFFGAGFMGLGARNNPLHTVVAAWDWGAYLGEAGLSKGVRVATSSFTRHHVNANLQRAKVVGHYVNSVLARYEAIDHGYDEAIMLDAQGCVAEGTGENLFLVRDGVVFTPDPVNILDGITRQTVLEILRREGYTIRETRFGRDLLYVADEVFMVGTAAEVTPIRQIDRIDMPTTPGPVTQLVQSTYLAGVRGEVDWMQDYITTC